MVTRRLMGLDAARFVAALAIVWLHAAHDGAWVRPGDIGRFAVPFFTAGATLLLVQGLHRDLGRSWGDYFVSRLARVYVPFLCWTVIYLGSRWFKGLVLGGALPIVVGPALLWIGSAQHLWFLPFLFLIGIVAFPVVKGVVGHPRIGGAVAIGCVIAGLLAAVCPLPGFVRFDPGTTWGQTSYFLMLAWGTLPAVFWGIALGIVVNRFGVAGRGLALVGAVVAIACIVFIVAFRRRSVLLENVAGLGWLVFGLGPWGGRIVERLARLVAYAYGIYLSHVLFVEAIATLGVKLHCGDAWWFWSGNAVVSALLATLLSVWIGRQRWGRWLGPR